MHDLSLPKKIEATTASDSLSANYSSIDNHTVGVHKFRLVGHWAGPSLAATIKADDGA